jgi:serine/threonine-protein kinase
MESGRVLLGRYRLEEKIGEGGMGLVCRGRDLELERPVAVKVVRPDPQASDQLEERFLREAKRTAKLRHPGIVEVFDIGRTEEGETFFVMELLEGESLAARIRREGRLSQDLSVRVGMQVCDALACAHDAGIVHRDLKPANVMLVGAEPRVKVLDFGVAKQIDATTKLTETGMLVGTIDYMAPESIRGQEVDPRADVYSLGVMLWRMLTGVALFEAPNMAALVHAHLTQTPRPMRERAPEVNVTEEVEAVVRRCLAKNRDARFASMIEARDALRAAHEERRAPPSRARREPLPPLPAPTEREIDFDEPSQEVPLELEEIDRPQRAGSLAPLAPPAPAAPPPVIVKPAPAAPPEELPQWVTLLRLVPEDVGRTAGVLALGGLIILHTFLHGGAGSTIVLVLLALFGGAVVFAWRKR